MRTDIVLVNFLMAPDLIRCLETLGHWKHGTIWVINNSAQEPDSSADTIMLRSEVNSRSEAVYIESGENIGFGRACNLAFSRSQAEAVLLINPDARIETAGLLKLMALMEKAPHWGALSPSMYWNDSQSFLIPSSVEQTPFTTLNLALATRWDWWARLLAGRALSRMQMLSQQSSVVKVNFLSGAVLLVRREAAQEASRLEGLEGDHLFDPDYFMFFEDSDLSVRLRRAGWLLGVANDVKAVHHYRHKPYKGAMMNQSRKLYFKKRFPWFFRLSGALKWIDALTQGVDAGNRFELIQTPLSSAAALITHTQGASVVALSPSLLAWPAFYRPANQQATPLKDEDWALLEPGQYVALLREKDGQLRWCCFYRSAESAIA